jgi:hypothetical protein
MRGLLDVYFVLLDEADFFLPGQQQDARDVSVRHIAKYNPWIILVRHKTIVGRTEILGVSHIQCSEDYLKSLYKINSFNLKMGQEAGSHQCEACGTKFSSSEEFDYHKKYSRYRRPGCCWQ